MGGIFITFEEQKHQEADLNIKAMATQIGINFGIAILVMLSFCLLRPRHNLVYAPKYKYATDAKKPPSIGQGYFAWVKPLLTAKDEFLLERIGYDAVLFLRFLRLLRHLLLVMSIVGIFALIPVNIVATRYSGDWPPAAGIDFLSISGINYVNGKLSDQSDLRWYWSPFTATWVFTLVIFYFLHRFSNGYIKLRQQYFRQEDSNGGESGKTVLLSYLPAEHVRSDSTLKQWLESLGVVPFPIKDCLVGHANPKLTLLYEEHEMAVEHLEIALASYLNDGKKMAKKRPTMRVDGFVGFGGKKVDVIDYYTKQVSDLEKEINRLRHAKSKSANFGWVSFNQVKHAQACEAALNQYARHANKGIKEELFKVELDARPSPPPRDLLWANLPLDKTKRQMKRWLGRVIYWVFIFVWMIPIGALSATSNLINLIRMIPNSDGFIANHEFLMGMIQAYFTPIVMALFFILLPYFFRLLSQQQGYRTQTTLDRKVFLKLFAFFIINNLLVFTLVSIIVGIYGQIRALVASGSLANSDSSISEYVQQMAKNISDVSTFWIDYVCIKGLGLTMELCQMMPLITISLRKWISRPSPRQLREYARPPPFDYPQGYSLMVFFFTVSLLYSAMAPLILPFALMYFSIASLVYKYMLMYIYVTKIESGGKMWPVLFQTVNVGVLLFQVVMIIVLHLKGGHLQAYCMIPLPFLTLAYQWFYRRRLSDLGCYVLDPSWMEHQPYSAPTATTTSTTKTSKLHSLKSQFRDPAIHHKLPAPMVHDDVKHLLPQVYHHVSHPKETFEMVKQQYSTIPHSNQDSKNDIRQQNVAHRRKSQMMTMDLDDGLAIKFCTMTEEDVIETAMSDDDNNDNTSDSDGNNMLHKENSSVKSPQSYAMSNVRSGKIAEIMDTDDEVEEEQRGLVQNDHMHHYWRRDSQPSMQSSTSLLAPYTYSAAEAHQDLMDWKLQRKGITSEFVDIYESLPAAQPATEDLLDLSTLKQQQQYHHDEDNHSHLSHRLRDLERRQSAPSLRLKDTFIDRSQGRALNDECVPSLRRIQSMIVFKESDSSSATSPRRRLSHSNFIQYGKRHKKKDLQQNQQNQYRRHSFTSLEQGDEDRQARRGSWIRQLDHWWIHRFDQYEQPSRLNRSFSISNTNHTPRASLLQRSQTMCESSLQEEHQQRYLDNDSRIRITYYDDLLEYPDNA